MASFLKWLRPLFAGLLALSFFMAVTASSCTSKKSGSNNAEQTEHPAGAEHPSDSVATENEHPEHPEHPSGSGGNEHPN
jgi:hypothetical protein